MKLFYSQNSPYARVARIAVMEAGLNGEVEQIRVVNRKLDSPLLKHNPTCRVPTLVHGEMILGESRLICAYIDDLQGREQFFRKGKPDWDSLSVESVIIGFLDGVVAWVSESRRPQNPVSDSRIEFGRSKVLRCLKYFENAHETRPELFPNWDFAGISLACAFSLMDFHAFIPDWKSKHTGLSEWFSENEGRPSMTETAPH